MEIFFSSYFHHSIKQNWQFLFPFKKNQKKIQYLAIEILTLESKLCQELFSISYMFTKIGQNFPGGEWGGCCHLNVFKYAILKGDLNATELYRCKKICGKICFHLTCFFKNCFSLLFLFFFFVWWQGTFFIWPHIG